MWKTLALILLGLIIALGGGGFSLLYVLDHPGDKIGAVTSGAWVSYPELGTPDADPYARARYARDGALALGRAEGVTFSASEDSSGQRLMRSCTYRLSGPVPASRFWTIYAADQDGRVLAPLAKRPASLHSLSLLRDVNGGFTLNVSSHAQPGNWLVMTGSGQAQLILTLYDTPPSSSNVFTDGDLPRIDRIKC